MVQAEYVPETRFGIWFQGTWIWQDYVVVPAFEEMLRLLGPARPQGGSILEAGCGDGHGISLLERHFRPREIEAVDIDPQMVDRASIVAGECECECECRVRCGDVSRLGHASDTFDVVYCHQTLHHVSDQRAALCELHRVLKPGGLLLLAESCRRFISSPLVRLFFRHPMQSQRTAEQYLELLDSCGFEVAPEQTSTPRPFWSLPDLGLLERFRRGGEARKEATQLVVVARRPEEAVPK